MKLKNGMALRNTLFVGSLLALGMPAFALPVTGIIGFSGTRLMTFTMSPGNSFIDFQDPVAGGTGEIDADNRTGFFTVVPNNDPGTIRDMSSMPNNPPYAYVPVNTPNLMIDNFLTFASLPTTNIRLTFLPLADCSGGGTCSGPFQLLQNGVHVSVSINILGQVLNGPDSSPFTGTITAQFLNNSVLGVFNAANSTNGITADSYSGAISASAIPEPETATLLGLGLIAMLLGGLRAKHRSSSN